MSVRLCAVGWAHERCMRPMRAAAAAWARLHPGIEVEWHERSGESFAEEPLEHVAPGWDIISIDYPFVGSAWAKGSLAPLDDLLDPDELGALARDAIGPSHESYAYGGRQWALATDAACQVAVVRPDLLGPESVAQTWDDVLELAREAPGRVMLGLGDHELSCTFLTLCASAGRPAGEGADRYADPEVGLRAVAWLAELAPLLPEDAHGTGVIEALRRPGASAYAPLQWGYTNYSRPESPPPRLRFVDIPSFAATPVGSTLGGAGLAVSAWSAHPREAAAFAAWVTGSEAQTSIVFPNGGQPGSRTAWLDVELDRAAGGFFSGTLATMEAARIRPSHPWWPAFQRDGGAVLRRGLLARDEPDAILEAFERCYLDCRSSE